MAMNLIIFEMGECCKLELLDLKDIWVHLGFLKILRELNLSKVIEVS